MRILRAIVVVGLIGVLPSIAAAQAKLPSEAEVKALLQKEPIDEATWPIWRERLADWLGDFSLQTEPAYNAAERFLNGLAKKTNLLPARYDKDHLAWYFLGTSYIYQKQAGPESLLFAEHAFRRSIAIQPRFARAHRNLAQVLVLQTRPDQPESNPNDPRLPEAEQALQEALRLDPTLPLAGIDGLVSLQRHEFAKAAARFEMALQKEPKKVGLAELLAQCIVFDDHANARSARIRPLAEQFPDSGKLASLYALSLAQDNRRRAAYEQLQRVRALGVDPAKFFPKEMIERIESEGQAGLMDLLGPILFGVGVLAGLAVLVPRIRKALARKPAAPKTK